MKKSLPLITLLLLAACGGVKKTQKALNNGNYLSAIDKAIDKLSNNKTKKGNQEYVLLLEEAFKKNEERELENISYLKNDDNPANLESVYTSYLNLKKLQSRIAPLLPLPIYSEDRNANFNFKNYDDKIIRTKTELTEYLYANATSLLENAANKLDYRQAYDDFNYLNEINPGYLNTTVKMDKAYQKGLEYVKIELRNDTEQIIPERLEEELLNFNINGIDNLWTQFHKNPVESVKYDYAMYLDFREIIISPEQISEKQMIKEKQIKDGYDYVLDANGNVAKDSLGNDIKIDKFKTVKCSFYQFTQFKNAQVGAKVSFVNLENNQEIDSYPLASEFIFEHVYANYKGDKRALDKNLIALSDLVAVPFPTDEQMVYDAGEDLKARLKNVLQQHNFN